MPAKAARKPSKATARRKAGRDNVRAKPARRVGGKPANPKGQRLADGRKVTTTSTFSPRLLAVRADLERELRKRFGRRVQAVTAYNMHGWRIKRPVEVKEWTGTIDANFVHVFVAERANGITLHLWNPYVPDLLQRNAKPLGAAGFKVMVGCLQFTRKQEFPLSAVTLLLDDVAAAMAKEG